jgi:predicted AlkP superfamily pyrophosphatase or phosphodiesterase
MRSSALAAALLLCLAFITATSSIAAPPRLVVLISVDQLLGDMPARFKQHFDAGGYRYLMDQGVVYTQAEYRHATTFTATGHATLATGGNSPEHGMVGNEWFDYTSGQEVYCVGDTRYHALGGSPDPTTGSSPRNLTSSTFGDELVRASRGRSRVFSVSIKDRGAIIPAGQLGKAFWFAKATGTFETSTFYYDDYPGWAKAWNDAKPADAYQHGEWTLCHNAATYACFHRDRRNCEVSYKLLGGTFPHPLENPVAKDFYSTLAGTPYGDELTCSFAKALLTGEKLGQGDATDLLTVSFSATDYVGHSFGPNSLEAEDNQIRLDRTLADLFQHINRQVGLEKTLIILSADHGVCASPEYLLSLGVSAGRHDVAKLLTSLNRQLRDEFAVDVDLIKAFAPPSLYLNLRAIAKHELDVQVVERAVAKQVLQMPGFAYAVTRTDLEAGKVDQADPILAKVQRAFHPARSGNVLLMQSPGWFLSPDQVTGMHGSPYSYDTHVPLMFAGAGLQPQAIDRAVGPEDVAATVAKILNIPPPSGSTGEALVEVVQGASN